ncbi:MAG: hypothetical protein H6817_07975 [Phycisphaerales bacterium]|nr:hypothetical protein [Phycisphaerales bacterium]
MLGTAFFMLYREGGYRGEGRWEESVLNICDASAAKLLFSGPWTLRYRAVGMPGGPTEVVAVDEHRVYSANRFVSAFHVESMLSSPGDFLLIKKRIQTAGQRLIEVASPVQIAS